VPSWITPARTSRAPQIRVPGRTSAAARSGAAEVVYTHNLADKTRHARSVALRTVAAIREMPRESRPKRLYGCEVWRGLDWMVDADKVIFSLDQHENIAMSLVGIFDSQIVGGKRTTWLHRDVEGRMPPTTKVTPSTPPN